MSQGNKPGFFLSPTHSHGSLKVLGRRIVTSRADCVVWLLRVSATSPSFTSSHRETTNTVLESYVIEQLRTRCGVGGCVGVCVCVGWLHVLPGNIYHMLTVAFFIFLQWRCFFLGLKLAFDFILHAFLFLTIYFSKHFHFFKNFSSSFSDHINSHFSSFSLSMPFTLHHCLPYQANPLQYRYTY